MNIVVVIQGLAAIAWLAVVAVAFMTFANIARDQRSGIVNANRGPRLGGGLAVIIGLLIVALLLTGGGFGLVFLQADQYAVVISAFQPNGYRLQPLGPGGLHWIIPGAESVRVYSIAYQTYTMSATATEGQIQGDDAIQIRTKDGQQVSVDASVIYAIDPAQLINLHIKWQDRYQDNLVRPTSRGIIRNIASQYDVEEIVSTKRGEMEKGIDAQLATELSSNYLILQSFVLRDIRFSDEYAKAVEQKQISQQQALQAAYIVEQKKQEAQQAVEVAKGQAAAAIQAAEGAKQAAILKAEGQKQTNILEAEGEAQALTLINDALKDNPSLLTYRYIEKLAPNVQVMYLPSGQPYLLPLPSANTTTATITTPAAPTPEPTPAPTPKP